MSNTKKVESPAVKINSQLLELSSMVPRSTIAVIDTIVQRGGFKGEELSTIGRLRDQSLALIQLVESIQSEIAAAQN